MAKRKPPRSKPASDSYSVFVSHATYDKWIATVLCEKIEKVRSHIHCWRDDHAIEGGSSLLKEIHQAIHECSELVVLLTPASIQRPWVLFEIGAAWSLNRKIVPLVYHVEAKDIPEMLRDIKWYELS